MSMSTLQAQLAALRGDSRQPGSIIPTNRRQEEAVGRGLAYSAEHGHSFRVSRDAKVKPSLIQPTARAAAHIPLSVLREQAQDALEELKEIHARGEDVLDDICNQIAALLDTSLKNRLPQNDENSAQKRISKVLSAMTPLLMEYPSPVVTILEFLLRRFDLHVAPDHSFELLWMTIPHAHQNPTLFHRVLQLIDLVGSGGSNQSYLWLRPYVLAKQQEAPQPSDQATPSVVGIPPPTILAQQMGKSLPLLLQCLKLARVAWEDAAYVIREKNTAEEGNAITGVSPRHRGCQHILSWSLFLLLQTLSWMRTVPNAVAGQSTAIRSGGGVNKQAVLQTLTPFLLQALKTNSSGTRRWGSVISAAMVSSLDGTLSPRVVYMFCQLLLARFGKLSDHTAQTEPLTAKSAIRGKNVSQNADVDEIMQTFIHILLAQDSTSFFSRGKQSMVPSKNDDRSSFNNLPAPTFLPLLNGYWLGCDLMNKELQKALLATIVAGDRAASFAKSLGRLTSSTSSPAVVAPFVGALVALCLSFHDDTNNNSLSPQNDTTGAGARLNEIQDEQINVLLTLLAEPHLMPLWKHEQMDLVASLTGVILCPFDPKTGKRIFLQAKKRSANQNSNDKEDEKKKELVTLETQRQTILESLRELDLEAFERGVMYAMKMERNTRRLKTNIKLLESALPQGIKVDNAHRMLPARIAVQHPDPEIRKQALERIASANSDSDEDDIGAFDEHNISLCLLRRWSEDDDIGVALVAGRLLCKNGWLEKLQLIFDNGSKIEDIAVSGFFHRSHDSAAVRLAKKDAKKIMEYSLSIAAYVAQGIGSQGDDGSKREDDIRIYRHLLIEAITAHLDSSHSSLAKLAASGLLVLYGESQSNTKNPELIQMAIRAISRDILFLDVVGINQTRSIRPDSDPEMLARVSLEKELFLRRQCTWVLISHFTTCLESDENVENSFPSYCLNFTLRAIEKRDTSLNVTNESKNHSFSKRCLEACVDKIEVASIDSALQALQSMASTLTNKEYRILIKEAIVGLSKKICEHVGSPTSTLSVIMEVATRPNSSASCTELLLEVAFELLSAEPYDSALNPAWVAFIPTLSLLQHEDLKVRESSVKLLVLIGTRLHESGFDGISYICSKATPNIALENNALPSFLARSMKSYKDAKLLAQSLLKLVVHEIAASTKSNAIESNAKSFFGKSWLSLGQVVGGCRVGSVMLDAMELSGEDAFSLRDRWDCAGKILLDEFLENDTVPAYPALAESLVRLLKGITAKSDSVLFTLTIGPSAGGGAGRPRSYSLSKAPGATFVDPYPTDMFETILHLLSGARKNAKKFFTKYLFEVVISSESWTTGIFSRFAKDYRKRFNLSVISFFHLSQNEISHKFLDSIPFEASDFQVLLRGCKGDKSSLEMTMDAIRLRATKIVKSSDMTSLFEDLSLQLELPGHSSTEDFEAADTRLQVLRTQSILLHEADLAGEHHNFDSKKFRQLLDTVAKLLGALDTLALKEDFQSRRSLRSRELVIKILIVLTKSSPQIAVPYLLVAIMSTVNLKAKGILSKEDVGDEFKQLVQAFSCNCSKSGMSIVDLFQSFTNAVRATPDAERPSLYHEICEALESQHSKGKSREAAVAGLISSSIALHVHWSGGATLQSQVTGFHADVLKLRPTVILPNLHALLRHGRFLALLLVVDDSNVSHTRQDNDLPTPMDFARLAIFGRADKSKTRINALDSTHSIPVANLVRAIFQCCEDCLSQDSFRNHFESSIKSELDMGLKLLQEILATQNILYSLNQDAVAKDISSCVSFVLNSLEHSQVSMQGALPLQAVFSSLISSVKRSKHNSARLRALNYMAERISLVPEGSADIRLFVDFIPYISGLVMEKEARDEEVTSSLQPAALFAIERIVVVCQGKVGKDEQALQALISVVSYFIKNVYKVYTENTTTNFADLEESDRSLICTSALCCASVVGGLDAKSLSVFPKLLSSLVTMLSMVNSEFLAVAGKDSPKLSVLQHALVRSLSIIVETMPQFVAPYLKLVLTEQAVLSKALRMLSSTSEVKKSVDSFDRILAKVPPRLLIPVAAAAMEGSVEKQSVECIIDVLGSSLEKASVAEGETLKFSALNVITKACAYSCSPEERLVLVKKSTRALVTLVMKLSELQLRTVFGFLREWRGDIDAENPDKNAAIRFAFWSFCCALSQELDYVFLPCLGVVVDDVVAELSLATNVLNKQNKSEKITLGNKKRRIKGNGVEDCVDERLQCVSPIILCLTQSFKADARKSGSWTKSADGRRYNAILEPLGKLLLCRFPRNFEHLVNRAGEKGTIVKCLTAMATAAAGNEDLWKPLNHIVLEACSYETRSDIRKAGISCLRSLFLSLGEEYMILLSECLPVLNELLEDTDEEVAAIAKRCLTIAEDLTKEDLQDMLR